MKGQLFFLVLILGFCYAGYQINDCFAHHIIIENPYHTCWTPVDWQHVDSYPPDTLSIYGLKNEDHELYLTRCSNANCTGDCYEIEETLKFSNYCIPRTGNDTYISWLLDDALYYSAFDIVRWLGVNYGHPCNDFCYCNSSSYCVGCFDGYWGESCNETCECADQENGYCERYSGECLCYLGHDLSSGEINATCETTKCNHRCACDEDDNCKLCYPGWWGPDCSFDCSLDCDGGSCSMENGDCDVGEDAEYATCSVSDWGDWSDCSNQCNGGIRYRVRSVEYVYPENINCANTAEYEVCNAHSCPILKFEMTGDLDDDTETNIVSSLSDYVSSSISYQLLSSQTSGSSFTVQIMFYYNSSDTEITYVPVVDFVESGLTSSIESSTGYSIVDDSISVNGVKIFQGGKDIYLTGIIFVEKTNCSTTQSTVQSILTLAKKNYEQFNSASMTITVDSCTDLSTGAAEMVISMLINPDMDSMSTVSGDNELVGNEEAALSFLDFFSTNSDGLQLFEEAIGYEIGVIGKMQVVSTSYSGSASTIYSSYSSYSSGIVIGLAVAVAVLSTTTIIFLVLWRKSESTATTISGDYSYSSM